MSLSIIKNQLDKAIQELKDLNNEENQLVYGYVEYASVLVAELINEKNKKSLAIIIKENFGKASRHFIKSEDYKKLNDCFKKINQIKNS